MKLQVIRNGNNLFAKFSFFVLLWVAISANVATLDQPSASLFVLPELVVQDQDLAAIIAPAINANDNTTDVHPRPRDVTISLLPSDDGDGTFKSFPLVITPKKQEQRSVAFLSELMEANREWVSAMMLKYGAVLFRDFGVTTAQDVQDMVVSYEPERMSDVYRGTSPRHAQGGTRYVFSAAEIPSHWPIAQHLEMSFLAAPPRKLFFSALSAPKTIGGETAVTDFRAVYRDIPEELRRKLQTKKLRYTRTHKFIAETNTHDVAAMLSWPEMFRIDNKTVAEELAAQEDMKGVHWVNKNQDTFVSEYEDEAFQLHPETGEPVWFNHINVFHWTTFPAELYAAYRRTGDLRYLGRSVYIWIKSIIKYGIMRQKMALNIAFGDGEPISIWEMHQIRTAVHKNTVYNRWQKGDIIAIDNFSTAHGRQPTYDSGRNIVVAWMEPVTKANALRDAHLEASETTTHTLFATNEVKIEL